jgi:hypothetical protein
VQYAKWWQEYEVDFVSPHPKKINKKIDKHKVNKGKALPVTGRGGPEG